MTPNTYTLSLHDALPINGSLTVNRASLLGGGQTTISPGATMTLTTAGGHVGYLDTKPVNKRTATCSDEGSSAFVRVKNTTITNNGSFTSSGDNINPQLPA